MSQTDRVLAMLRKRPASGVANYEFTDAGILRYSSRICELRKNGYHITSERLIYKGKTTNTYLYRIVEPEKPKQDKTLNIDGMRFEITN